MVGETNKKFEEEVKPHVGDWPIHKFECAPADPGLEICKMARRIGADLILMGSHNDSEKPNLSRVNYVGMTILEKAPCPVMLVPALLVRTANLFFRQPYGPRILPNM
ncbi:MAG: universal stress protein [Desulfobacterales bacterium]